MIVTMKPQSTVEDVEDVVKALGTMGLSGYVIRGKGQTHVEILGQAAQFDQGRLHEIPMVERIFEKTGPLLAGCRQPGDRTLQVPLGAAATAGGKRLAIIAGPCSVEGRSQLLEIAHAVKEAGAVAMRGGAFKPRTSPYSFQGHGEKGLEWLAEVREQTGLAIVTEVMRCEHVDLVSSYADALQVGSRNMHHTHLLREVGRREKPVLLKRGWSATLEEFLLAAEYIMLEGNHNVVLCERGIRTFETYVRNTLALAVVPEIKRLSKLPVIVDPSHGTGKRHLVKPMSYAAVACGADGLLIEVHSKPDIAWTDGSQSLGPEDFSELMAGLPPFARVVEREA